MKISIVYDSLYGNTEKIAQAMAKAFSSAGSVTARAVSQTQASALKGINLLIIGSPTHGGRPSPKMLEFLTAIPEQALAGVQVAAFDTRFLEKDQPFALRLLIKTIGYAAPRITQSLESKGGTLIAAPEGFIVQKKEGPLKPGELERAVTWAKGLVGKA